MLLLCKNEEISRKINKFTPYYETIRRFIATNIEISI